MGQPIPVSRSADEVTDAPGCIPTVIQGVSLLFATPCKPQPLCGSDCLSLLDYDFAAIVAAYTAYGVIYVP